MGYPTKEILKEAIKTFTRQFYCEDVYNNEVEEHLENYSSGLADILWTFLYESKIQTEIQVNSGIAVQVNTETGTGATTMTGHTITKGNIIPPEA